MRTKTREIVNKITTGAVGLAVGGGMAAYLRYSEPMGGLEKLVGAAFVAGTAMIIANVELEHASAKLRTRELLRVEKEDIANES